MKLKWRIIVLFIQLCIIVTVTIVLTGQPVVNEIWYFSGLLAIIINPILLEPWYPKPQDVLANTIIGIFLTLVSKKDNTHEGWVILQVILFIFFIITLILILSSLRKDEQPKSKFLNAAKSISRIANAATIYSAVFWLSILESFHFIDKNFWLLGGAWTVMMILGKVNWQTFFNVISNKPISAFPIAMIGPSFILISSPSFPKVGSRLKITGGTKSTSGVLINKVSRLDDEWGQILLIYIN